MKRPNFSLSEVTLLSLMAALVYVLRALIKTPIRLPGHNGVLWVIPIILGVGIVKKTGSATYVGALAGVMISFLGASNEGPFKIPEYLVMGLTIDILAAMFRGHMDNLLAGFIVGAIGNLAKLAINYIVTILSGIPANFILAGLGLAATSHLIFGGLGGFFSALILGRLIKSKLLHRIVAR